MENVIIIGGGPAGLSAALYTARANLSPLLFAGSPPGGQLTLTTEVENYPGIEAVMGPELVEKMRNQAKKFEARIMDQNITKVDFTASPFTVGTVDKNYQAKTVIIATGAKALWLGLPSEQRLRGKGVSACATCDGFFFRNKVVGVVGGGDTALEEAETLTRFASRVYIIHRRDCFRASKIMQDRVLNNPKVEIIYNAIVEEVVGEKRVEGVRLKMIDDRSSMIEKTKKSYHQSPMIHDLKVDGLFIAIGHKPDTDLFRDQIEVDSKGYIITSDRFSLELAKSKMQNAKFKMTIENSKLETMQSKFDLNYQTATSAPGVFAAGDNVDYQYRQAGTAAGMGIAAALEVERYLEENF